MYSICCHVVAHELDVNKPASVMNVNKLISMRGYEKAPHTFVTSPNELTLKMI